MATSYDLLISDRHGIYIPQLFAKNYDESKWRNIDPEDIKILQEGPENEWYWETWDSVMDSAEYVDEDNNVYKLHQDGDVWVYCHELMTEEDKSNLFGDY